MNFFKSLTISVFLLFILSCEKNTKIPTSPSPKIEFKIGESGVKKELKKEFEFENLTFGSYYTTNLISGNKKGVTLNFQIKNLNEISDSLIVVYEDISKEVVKKHLLNLEEYDLVITSFNTTTKKGVFEKNTSIKITNTLK